MARVPAALVRLVQTQGLHGVLIGLAHELPLWQGRADLIRALAKQMGGGLMSDAGQGRMAILPPAPGKCAWCAVEHDPGDPHNAQSLYYGVVFLNTYGRSPTWADAAAHCTPELRQTWREALAERGVIVPPDSAYVAPVRREDPVAEGPGEDDLPDRGVRRLLGPRKRKRVRDGPE